MEWVWIVVLLRPRLIRLAFVVREKMSVLFASVETLRPVDHARLSPQTGARCMRIPLHNTIHVAQPCPPKHDSRCSMGVLGVWGRVLLPPFLWSRGDGNEELAIGSTRLRTCPGPRVNFWTSRGTLRSTSGMIKARCSVRTGVL